MLVAHAFSRVRHAAPQVRIIVPATNDAAPLVSNVIELTREAAPQVKNATANVKTGAPMTSSVDPTYSYFFRSAVMSSDDNGGAMILYDPDGNVWTSLP